jgi:Tfp pilus assembly protein PilO
MYFLPRHTPLYAAAVNIKPWQRYVFSIVLAATIIYGTLALSNYIAAITTQYEHEIRTAKQQLQQRTNAIAQTKQLQNTLTKLQHELKQKAIIDKRMSSIAFLLQHAHDGTITIKGCSHQQERVKSWYTKHLIALEATGTFNQLIKFLEKLRTSQKMVQCRNLNLVQSKPGLFNLSCVLSLYTLTAPEDCKTTPVS